MYGLSTAEYVDLLQEMEHEELLSACADFGLRLRADSSKPPPTEKALRQLLRRHLLQGAGGADNESDTLSKAKASSSKGLKGGFFDTPRPRKKGQNQPQQKQQQKQEHQLTSRLPGGGGVVERFDKSAGRWVSTTEESPVSSSSSGRSMAAAAASSAAAHAPAAAALAAAAAPRRVSKFKAAREQAKAQAMRDQSE